jgi:hypothetical protein
MGFSHSERFIYDEYIVESKQFGASLVRILPCTYTSACQALG